MKPTYNLFFLFAFYFFLFVHVADAQNVRDSSLFIPMVKFSYAAQLPGGDLARRFGANSLVGLNFSVKTKHNLFFGVEGGFIFGNHIKEDGILDSLRTSSGFIIDQNGQPAIIRLFERGYVVSAHVGKLFRVQAHSKNSGLLIYAGPTYFIHKIKIYDIGRQTVELLGMYAQGYDRLTSGFGLREFIGYVYLGNNRILNFFAGFDFIQAFTKSQRSYDYDLMKSDTKKRVDLLSGIRIGWILPLYTATPQQYYYQ